MARLKAPPTIKAPPTLAKYFRSDRGIEALAEGLKNDPQAIELICNTLQVHPNGINAIIGKGNKIQIPLGEGADPELDLLKVSPEGLPDWANSSFACSYRQTGMKTGWATLRSFSIQSGCQGSVRDGRGSFTSRRLFVPP
ncbi:MAG: hypothetical protein JO212_03535 [Acetobacteraceae bacterium]|nr:hypothetical protein [Acetobacteraceae bacterium]MBV8589122.1 hypothetical protein [Acetobacteraceae bacterium]